MLVQINVTHADIDKGVQKHCNLCPIARAALRAIGKPIMVDGTDLEIYPATAQYIKDSFNGDNGQFDCKWEHAGELPEEAKEFVTAFDEGKPVAPFHFAMHVTPRETDDDDLPYD